MNNDADGVVTPPGPWGSSIAWDSTVAGGGLFGSDAQASGRILAHTTPWSWQKDNQGAFQNLRDVKIGNPVAITTDKGRLCYTVAKKDSVLKDQINVVFDKEKVTPGIVYLVTCDRARDYGNGSTVDNLVVSLQYNQQLTNTGSC